MSEENTLPFEVVEDLPTVYKKISIESYGIARRCYEESMDKVNEIMLDPHLDDDQKQVEMDKWQTGADEQRKEIEIFEKKCPDYDAKFLGSNIKVLAKKYNLRIPDVENLVGVSNGYISRTVNPDSKKRLSIDVVWKLAKVFKVNMEDLLDRDLTEPPKSIIPVRDFLEKLDLDTAESQIHWKNLGRKYNESTSDFYTISQDEEGKNVASFIPPDSGWSVDLAGDIYAATVNYRTLYIMAAEDLFEDNVVLIYTKRTIDVGFEEYKEVLELLCNTSTDSSGILSARANSLLNTIKLHEKDFTVSDDAKSFIDGYLNPDETPWS